MENFNAQTTSEDISTILSSNLIGGILEYVELTSLPPLRLINKKFNRLICNEGNVFPIFTEFLEELEERERSCSITNVEDLFCEQFSKTSYISAFKNKLLERNEQSEKKYTSSQIIPEGE